jgi:hypothetical protein
MANVQHDWDNEVLKMFPLPSKFTDQECAAYVWMWNRENPWVVDLFDKSVKTGKGVRFDNLVEFAKHFGWDGV